MNELELYHYGVLGMKWGVRRASRKSSKNEKLRKKALNYDQRSAKAYKKSEKIHAKEDLERSNRAARKAAKYKAKSAATQKKANAQTSDFSKTRLEKKAAKLNYKGFKQEMKAERISKEAGYGKKAMKYSVKSDKLAAKAAKVRMELASNEAYIAKTKQKVNSLPPQEIEAGRNYIDKLLK